MRAGGGVRDDGEARLIIFNRKKGLVAHIVDVSVVLDRLTVFGIVEIEVVAGGIVEDVVVGFAIVWRV